MQVMQVLQISRSKMHLHMYMMRISLPKFRLPMINSTMSLPLDHRLLSLTHRSRDFQLRLTGLDRYEVFHLFVFFGFACWTCRVILDPYRLPILPSMKVVQSPRILHLL